MIACTRTLSFSLNVGDDVIHEQRSRVEIVPLRTWFLVDIQWLRINRDACLILKGNDEKKELLAD